jgi:uncharacterized Zn finger protein (UPF0148 family)
MSNGFDKEAEREKLREKLSDDYEKREHTQRMSELLLKGATMTNRHCDDCGDPIFRHDGQEFCPSCHTVDAADVQAAEDAPAGAETPESSGLSQTAQPPEAGAVDGSGALASSDDPAAAERSPTPAAGSSAQPRGYATSTADSSTAPSDPAGGGAPPSAGAPADRSSPSADRSPAGTPSASSAAAAGSGSVADARASLTRTLHRFAAAAEATDDPRRARDHLQAAREAAEALAALD